MTQLTEQQIEAQIKKAIANSTQIEATEPRANHSNLQMNVVKRKIE